MLLKKIIKSLRVSRVWHRYLGTALALFLFISAITGILLALKKDVDLLQPPTQKGSSKVLTDWKSIADIADIATTAFHTAHPNQLENTIDRIDARPSKGMVKVLFKKGYWEVQVDAVNGEILSIAKRHSDWIEALHDGSIIADWFKLISMNMIGWGLLLMIISGLWLWYGPKRYRKLKKQR